MCFVCYSVVLLGSETGSLQLLAPLLLTGGKGADLVIRGNVVLNTLSARSISTLLRYQILSVFRPRGVPGPTSKLSPRVPAQMGRRGTEHEGGENRETCVKGKLAAFVFVPRPGRVRLQ
jgi:hypothetical protein